MSLLDDYLPRIPSISEVGELMTTLPTLPSLPRISEVGELMMPGLPELPSMPDFLPSISEVGELMMPRLPGLPSLPSLPSISEVGELARCLPGMPATPMPIAEVGEMVLPDMSRPHTPEELAKLRAVGGQEANRGLTRQDCGDNVVGQAGDTSIIGEDGPLFPYLFGDNPEMQRFGRLHDVEAAMAEADSENDTGFLLANLATAGVGGLGTLVSGDADVGAAMADSLFRRLGYETGDYATVQADAARGHQPQGQPNQQHAQANAPHVNHVNHVNNANHANKANNHHIKPGLNA